MKKLILFTTLLFSFYFSNAQPIPDCARNITDSKIFLEGPNELLCDLTKYGAYPSDLSGCFVIDSYRIKDSLNTRYFKINIYKDIYNYSNSSKKDIDKMEVYFFNVMNKNFNYYLIVPDFKKGSFFIDVSKTHKIKYVECQMCRQSIQAFDITPEKWSEIKKWGD
jgi:hypothetical protein